MRCAAPFINRPQGKANRMLRRIQGFGWVPDLPDQRDRRHAAPRKVLAALPKSCDLRRHCPPVLAYREAEKHQAIRYRRLTPTLRQLKGCLAEGYPFVFGFSVYESFESAAVARTGKVPLPAKDERSLGGHAVLATGYDDRRQHFIVMNSWSAAWGAKGYFTLPYSYATNADLADDFWTVRVVET